MSTSKDKPDEPVGVEAAETPQNATNESKTPSKLHSNRSPSPNHLLKRSSTAPISSSTSSPVRLSPRTSREPSPTRPSALKLQQSSATKLSRSRKGSQDLSPNRAANYSVGIPDTPSAAAIQRALSATGTTRLPSPVVSESPGDPPRPQKQTRTSAGVNTSRLRSPPRSASIPRGPGFPALSNDQEPPQTPSIIVNHPTPKSASSFDEPEEDMNMSRGGLRSPGGRGTGGMAPLEAVRESSLPETPAIGMVNKPPPSKKNTASRPPTISEDVVESDTKAGPLPTESGSESGGNKGTETKEKPKELRKNPTAQTPAKQPTINSRKSFSQLPTSKNKIAGEGSVRNMTVETETVSSIPQNAVGGGAVDRGVSGRGDLGGIVRLKPSSETIRPKKEKKKTARKVPSLNSGAASSKADFFEAKVRDAVNEANSSDSEETFVYESNPLEPTSRPQRRYHSRTPSATSMASQIDHYGGRYRHEGHNSLVGKKSMKFSSNANLHGVDVDSHSAVGTPTSARPGNGTILHHHIGRHGRTPHQTVLDNDTFSNSAKSLKGAGPRLSTRSPYIRIPGTSKSTSMIPYELEADDERTPLLRPRSPRIRDRNTRRRHYRDGGYSFAAGGGWARMCSCCLIGSLVSVLAAALIVALVLCSKPLMNVEIKSIENVLASDKEIMFDLHAHAINPNLVSIQVNELDILIHARSKYVGTGVWGNGGLGSSIVGSTDLKSSERHSEANAPLVQENGTEYRAANGIDEGTDPIEEDPHVMLLGQIFGFDSPLIFEASPLRHQTSSSVGEVRLAKPGNRTEQGGSDRWETVIQHPFELIVRGVIRYTLPINSKVRSASVKGKAFVEPEDSEGDSDPDKVALQLLSTPEAQKKTRLALKFSA